MRYVIEAIFRPFMNWFESMGIPGQVFPVMVVMVLWLVRVPRDIIKKQVTWRDWVGSLGVIIVIAAFFFDAVNTPDAGLPQERNEPMEQELQDIRPEDIDGPWRRITPEDVEGIDRLRR